MILATSGFRRRSACKGRINCVTTDLLHLCDEVKMYAKMDQLYVCVEGFMHFTSTVDFVAVDNWPWPPLVVLRERPQTARHDSCRAYQAVTLRMAFGAHPKYHGGTYKPLKERITPRFTQDSQIQCLGPEPD